MITKISLKNFQAHKQLLLTFSPGVNTIVGPTNIGKSSVFRAVRWLVEHRPISGLPTFGTDDTQVRISTELGMVVRFKNEEGYGYKIDDQPVFLACGTNQPSEVQQVLGLAEINLQGQHDPPFLLTLTPGQMAKELNRIVDLSVIDKTMSATTAAVTAAKSQVSAMEEIVKAGEAEVAKLAWLPAAEQEFEKIQILDQKLQAAKLKQVLLESLTYEVSQNTTATLALESYLAELVELVELMQALDSARSREWQIAQTMGNLRDVLSTVSVVNSAGKALKALSVDSDALQAVQASFTRLDAVVQSYARLERLDAFWVALDEVTGDQDQLSIVKSKVFRLRDVFTHWKTVESEKTKQESEITRLEKEKPICPTCKRPL